MISSILLIIGFILLYKGADWLVQGSSSLAARMRVSDFVVGLTIVALGTSVPELFVSVIGSVQGTSEIVVGNIIGSNVINIFVILGIASLLMPLTVTKGTVWKEIPFTLFAMLILAFLVNDTFLNHSTQSMLSRVDGFVLLLFFIAFMYYAFSIARKKDVTTESPRAHTYSLWISILAIASGLALLLVGAKWVIDGAVYLARALGVSESFIGLTIVAGGTSLPELATSIVAAYKKNAEIAVGNIVGSNIFNICFILGISSLIRPIPFQPKSNVDIGMALLGSIFLFVFMFTGKKHRLDKWEGILFLIIYLGYLSFLIMKA
ncbi:MAG: calcium/sodium antiporter [Pseudomonadota bacterium]